MNWRRYVFICLNVFLYFYNNRNNSRTQSIVCICWSLYCLLALGNNQVWCTCKYFYPSSSDLICFNTKIWVMFPHSPQDIQTNLDYFMSECIVSYFNWSLRKKLSKSYWTEKIYSNTYIRQRYKGNRLLVK